MYKIMKTIVKILMFMLAPYNQDVVFFALPHNLLKYIIMLLEDTPSM